MESDELLTQSIPAQAAPAVTPCSCDGIPPGTVLAGRYQVVEFLGRGGMGEVYRAEDQVLRQAVALKFLPEHLASQPEHRSRMLEEVRAARQVTHPHVCRVHDVSEIEGRPFLIMEFIDGEDLASLLRRLGRLNQEKGLQIARQVTEGLVAVHRRGLLHRDLKPANIMIDGRGEARLTDFGLAVSSQDSDREGLAGTPGYLPAEVLAGGKPTVQSDLYALGLVFFELFTGQRASGASGSSGHRLGAEATFPADMDAALVRTIRWCLNPDPAQRPASALAVLGALPGGDPLGALVAAGETPSPDAVAMAGGTGALQPVWAWSSFGLLLLLMAAAIGWMDRVSLHRHAGLEKPPSMLVDRAQKVLWKLGHDVPIADSAFRFQYVASVRNAAAREASPERLAALKSGPLPLVEFQYRMATTPLMPVNPMSMVGAWDPLPLQASMATVRLDPQGRLLHFMAVPSKASDPRIVNWEPLLAEAGLDPGQLQVATPRLTPPLHVTSTMAWTQGTLRFEAGERKGRLVWFTTVPEAMPAGTANTGASHDRLAEWAATWFTILVLPVLCLLLARRNWKRDRVDLRGANRLAVVSFVSMALYRWFVAHHSGDVAWELRVFGDLLPEALYAAGVNWLGYLAIEPYLRRRWPHTLISWSRVMAGGLRDPRVGRDLLWGLVAGWGGVLLVALGRQVSGYPFVSARVPEGQWALSLAAILATPGDMAYFFVMVGVLLTALGGATRRVVVTVPCAAAAIGLIGAALLRQVSPVPLDYAVCGLLSLLAVGLLLRLGILAMLAFALPIESLGYPHSTALGTWPAMTTTAYALLTAILGVYGLVISLGGQPLFGKADDE